MFVSFLLLSVWASLYLVSVVELDLMVWPAVCSRSATDWRRRGTKPRDSSNTSREVSPACFLLLFTLFHHLRLKQVSFEVRSIKRGAESRIIWTHWLHHKLPTTVTPQKTCQNLPVNCENYKFPNIYAYWHIIPPTAWQLTPSFPPTTSPFAPFLLPSVLWHHWHLALWTGLLRRGGEGRVSVFLWQLPG